jgi:hypothetical protein
MPKLQSPPIPAKSDTPIRSVVRRWAVVFCIALLPLLPVAAAEPPLETHSNLQAVNEQGLSAWTGSLPFRVQGVLLNNPEEMVDATPRFVPWDDGAGAGQMGGQWQVFIQSIDPLDRGGTACWMGQNYGNLPFVRGSEFSYTDEEWLVELDRVNHDPDHRHWFRQGDLVEVTARRSLFFGGKRNINEAHSKDPDANFTIRLLQAGHGLPEPEWITLADVMEVDDGDPSTRADRFDPTRQSGGEYYQAMRVRIQDLELVDAEAWHGGAGQRIMVTDGAGRFLPLRMPRHDLGPAPTGRFDVVGIFNQESGSGIDGTFGYEIFAQKILVQGAPRLDVALRTMISWPPPTGDFVLEYTEDLAGAEWRTADVEPVLINGRVTVLVPVDGSKRIYRLRSLEP